MNLYFRNKTDKMEIGGHLKLMINSIPSITISAEGRVNITDDERKFASGMKLDFYGNALIDSPTTFEGAVKVYRELSEMAKKSKSVVRFSLSPITDYCKDTTTILNDISSNNVKEVSMYCKSNILHKTLRR